jgi:hypothetical protein
MENLTSSGLVICQIVRRNGILYSEVKDQGCRDKWKKVSSKWKIATKPVKHKLRKADGHSAGIPDFYEIWRTRCATEG